MKAGDQFELRELFVENSSTASDPVPSAKNLWVELVGSVIIARLRGIPTDALIRDCQSRIVAILNDTGCQRIMYDALELENPSSDIARTQQVLTSTLLDPAMRIAIVVANTQVAYFSRLAFGEFNHRVFYNDISGALKWLEGSERIASVTPFPSAKRTG